MRLSCIFLSFCLPFYYSVLEHGEDISHLNSHLTLYIYVYISEQKKKKEKRKEKGRKKSQRISISHSMSELIFFWAWMEDRPLLLFQSWLLLGLSWSLHLPCDCHVWKHEFFVLYYQIHVLSVEQWRKKLNSSDASKTWFCVGSVAQSYSALCDPMDCSTPASLSHSISWSLFILMSIGLAYWEVLSWFPVFGVKQNKSRLSKERLYSKGLRWGKGERSQEWKERNWFLLLWRVGGKQVRRNQVGRSET